MGYEDQSLSTIAKKLEPFFLRSLAQFAGGYLGADGETIIGKKFAGGFPGGSSIHGTSWEPRDSSGKIATDAVDFYKFPDEYDQDFTCLAERSVNLAHTRSVIKTGAVNAAMFSGYDGIINANEANCALLIGTNVGAVDGAMQAKRYTEGKQLTMSSSWQSIATKMYLRTDTLWAFRAIVAGIETGAARSYGYKIEGAISNDGGTTTLLAQTVTTIYEDDANFDCQAAADNTNNALLIQMIDSGNSGRTVRWCSRVNISELVYP